MKRKNIMVAVLCMLLCMELPAQEKLGVYAAAFYNLENLWDTDDDPNNAGDDDFTPQGKYHWTPEKYRQKLHNVAQVLAQLGKEYWAQQMISVARCLVC